MSILLNEEELARERNLFAPNNTSYKQLGGVKLNLRSLVEEQQKKPDAETAARNDKDNKPVVFVPPSC